MKKKTTQKLYCTVELFFVNFAFILYKVHVSCRSKNWSYKIDKLHQDRNLQVCDCTQVDFLGVNQSRPIDNESRVSTIYSLGVTVLLCKYNGRI